MIHEISSTLDPRIGQLTYLFTIESIPSSTIELLVKIKDELGVDEVHKGISDITRVVMIDWQIQKVHLHSMVFADLLEQHLLRVFVGDVTDHESCPSVNFNLNKDELTLSGKILYSFTSYPDTFLFLRVESCLW